MDSLESFWPSLRGLVRRLLVSGSCARSWALLRLLLGHRLRLRLRRLGLALGLALRRLSPDGGRLLGAPVDSVTARWSSRHHRWRIPRRTSRRTCSRPGPCRRSPTTPCRRCRGPSGSARTSRQRATRWLRTRTSSCLPMTPARPVSPLPIRACVSTSTRLVPKVGEPQRRRLNRDGCSEGHVPRLPKIPPFGHFRRDSFPAASLHRTNATVGAPRPAAAFTTPRAHGRVMRMFGRGIDAGMVLPPYRSEIMRTLRRSLIPLALLVPLLLGPLRATARRPRRDLPDERLHLLGPGHPDLRSVPGRGLRRKRRREAVRDPESREKLVYTGPSGGPARWPRRSRRPRRTPRTIVSAG